MAVDRIFENVLAQLPSDIEEATLHRPEFFDADEADPMDEPPDTTADEIHPYEDVSAADRIHDRGEDGEVIFEPSPNDKELVEGGIRVRGFDALAFYKSRRLIAARPYPGKWGIFYLKQSLVHVAWGIARAYPGYKGSMFLSHNFFANPRAFPFSSGHPNVDV